MSVIKPVQANQILEFIDSAQALPTISSEDFGLFYDTCRVKHGPLLRHWPCGVRDALNRELIRD